MQQGRRCVGITVGDPAGIGPEVLSVALSSLRGHLPGDIVFRVFGPLPVLDRLSDDLGYTGHALPSWLDTVQTTPDVRGIVTGRYTFESGVASIAALRSACADLASGEIDALVTGPVSKQAFADAGLVWPGQTEFVADALGCSEFAMMLGGPRLKVALVTTHLALRDVPAAISTPGVLAKIRVCDSFLRNVMYVPEPRIAVTGLNPHCGEGGRFGDEESLVIEPAVLQARAAGIDATGPLSADTVFAAAFAGRFDMVLAMYHDQGLGPLKLVHFSDAINVTMGLPRLRCSPDHGPAWDIAGKGLANPSSMINAVLFASSLKRD